MNERIKELALQARKYASEYVAQCKHYGYYMEQNEYELRFEEKFAELIVRECARVSERTGVLNEAEFEVKVLMLSKNISELKNDKRENAFPL